ncbi:hypothetical protein FRC12_018597 [Ceratobasidium sp. 428]|nr:hypothetical protein FRC12_018597 [Ceratobasidium sp. 428]
MDKLDPWVGLEQQLFGMSAEEVRRTDEAQVQALLKEKEKRRSNTRAVAVTVATLSSPDVDVADLASEIPPKRKQGLPTMDPADASVSPKKARHSIRQAISREEKKSERLSSGMVQPQLGPKPKVRIQSRRNPFIVDASPRDGRKYECAVVITSSSPST